MATLKPGVFGIHHVARILLTVEMPDPARHGAVTDLLAVVQLVEQAGRARLNSGSLTLTSDFISPAAGW